MDITQNSNLVMRTENTVNWYVYDGSNVQGPFAPEKLLEIRSAQKSNRSLMVSRVGLDKWYPIQELDSVMEPSETIQSEIRSHKQTFSVVFDQHMEELKKHEEAPPQPRVEPRNIPTHNFFAEQLAQETLASVKKPKPTLNELATSIQQTQQTIAKKQEQIYSDVEAITSTIQSSLQSTQHSPEFNYMMLKGRLRLGSYRSPFMHASFYYLLSLGLSIFFWYRHSTRELSWHIHNDFSRGGGVWDFFVFIPFIGMFAFYRLGKLVEEAERQNHYQSTHAGLAAWLGVFPPLAVFYLQQAMNKHWSLHVKHA